MSLTIKVGATLTGGSDVVLSGSGVAPGRSSFTTPDHTRLTPETVAFSISQSGVTKDSQGRARTGVKMSFTDVLAEEGCCTSKAGSVIVDMGVVWDLSQPEALADKMISYLRGVVYTTAFADAVKKGILPS